MTKLLNRSGLANGPCHASFNVRGYRPSVYHGSRHSQLRATAEIHTIPQTRLESTSATLVHNSAPPATKRMYFEVFREVAVGEEVMVVGSNVELGAWDAYQSLALQWHPGHVWKGSVAIHSDAKVEFKLVKSSGECLEWEEGDDRIIDLQNISAEGCSVSILWGHPAEISACVPYKGVQEPNIEPAISPPQPQEPEHLAITQTYTARIAIQKEVFLGQHLKLVGSAPELGSWDFCAAPAFTWTPDHVWQLELDLPIDKPVDWKVVQAVEDNNDWCEWQAGENTIINPQALGIHPGDVLQVGCSWDGPSRATIVENGAARLSTPVASPPNPEEIQDRSAAAIASVAQTVSSGTAPPPAPPSTALPPQQRVTEEETQAIPDPTPATPTPTPAPSSPLSQIPLIGGWLAASPPGAVPTPIPPPVERQMRAAPLEPLVAPPEPTDSASTQPLEAPVASTADTEVPPSPKGPVKSPWDSASLEEVTHTANSPAPPPTPEAAAHKDNAGLEDMVLTPEQLSALAEASLPEGSQVTLADQDEVTVELQKGRIDIDDEGSTVIVRGGHDYDSETGTVTVTSPLERGPDGLLVDENGRDVETKPKQQAPAKKLVDAKQVIAAQVADVNPEDEVGVITKMGAYAGMAAAGLGAATVMGGLAVDLTDVALVAGIYGVASAIGSSRNDAIRSKGAAGPVLSALVTASDIARRITGTPEGSAALQKTGTVEHSPSNGAGATKIGKYAKSASADVSREGSVRIPTDEELAKQKAEQEEQALMRKVAIRVVEMRSQLGENGMQALEEGVNQVMAADVQRILKALDSSLSDEEKVVHLVNMLLNGQPAACRTEECLKTEVRAAMIMAQEHVENMQRTRPNTRNAPPVLLAALAMSAVDEMRGVNTQSV